MHKFTERFNSSRATTAISHHLPAMRDLQSISVSLSLRLLIRRSWVLGISAAGSTANEGLGIRQSDIPVHDADNIREVPIESSIQRLRFLLLLGEMRNTY